LAARGIVCQERRETIMALIYTASEEMTGQRTGLTSLAAETRNIVDRHQEVQTRAYRKFSHFAAGLIVALALVMLLLSAIAVFA
jgi:hypothetical protein